MNHLQLVASYNVAVVDEGDNNFDLGDGAWGVQVVVVHDGDDHHMHPDGGDEEVKNVGFGQNEDGGEQDNLKIVHQEEEEVVIVELNYFFVVDFSAVVAVWVSLGENLMVEGEGDFEDPHFLTEGVVGEADVTPCHPHPVDSVVVVVKIGGGANYFGDTYYLFLMLLMHWVVEIFY